MGQFWDNTKMYHTHDFLLITYDLNSPNYSLPTQSLLNIHTEQLCSVVRSYPGVGAPWNVVFSRNFALLLSTCYNSCRWRGFKSNRRQLQGGSRPVNFEDIYESNFLPALRSLDLNGTFVWADGGGWFPFIQWLSWHCLGYLSKTPSDTRKN